MLDEVQVDICRGDDRDPLAGVVRLNAARERDVDIVVGREAWQTRLLSRPLTIDLEGAGATWSLRPESPCSSSMLEFDSDLQSYWRHVKIIHSHWSFLQAQPNAPDT